MTITDLKNNREEIIRFLKAMGQDLKSAMELAVDLASGCEDVEELKMEMSHYLRPVKETKNARILASLNEMEN